ncbi:hypothetical protein MAR_001317 [Mya arenaria]|uniref:HEPN domain-containing protein n=1 Tax=Mya arenaria TaxID=6604 RepID=A0ABY7FE77_MYAAR|nr:hypothetical protein MAR_001317 [Mya arenaria]
MASWKDILENEGYNQLIEAKKYTEELAKDDPEDEPYRSLYHARGIYKSVHKLIKKTADKHHWDEDFYFESIMSPQKKSQLVKNICKNALIKWKISS